MVQDGIKHEFTGTLFIPAPGEAEKIEARERENRPTPELALDSSVDYTTVLAPFPRQGTTRRVKMSGMDMLKLSQADGCSDPGDVHGA